MSNAGAWHSYWRDPYHLLLTIPWPGFFLLMVLGYGILNALFALAYLVGGDGIAQAHEILWDHRFIDIIHETQGGDRYIDFSQFHHVVAGSKL